MFVYEKKLQHPVRIKNPNPKLAKIIISQYGGPHGEMGASLRYLSQRYAMPYPELSAILTDIGSEVPKCSEPAVLFTSFTPIASAFSNFSSQLGHCKRPLMRQLIKIYIHMFSFVYHDFIHNISVKGIILHFSQGQRPDSSGYILKDFVFAGGLVLILSLSLSYPFA